MPYTARDVRGRERILRALLCAPPKAGKTTVSVLSSPGPVFVFNTDGKGALDGCAYLDPNTDFEAEDIAVPADFEKGLAHVKAHSKRFKTVVFDNLTFYVGQLFEEVRKEVGRDDPRAIYPEVTNRTIKMIRRLFRLPQHVILIGQIDPNESNTAASFGHVLAVSGKSKTLIPALVQDWLWLDTQVSESGKVTREFLLQPQGSWTKGARSVQGVKSMPADFTEFLRLASGGAPKTEPANIKPKLNGFAKKQPLPAT